MKNFLFIAALSFSGAAFAEKAQILDILNKYNAVSLEAEGVHLDVEPIFDRLEMRYDSDFEFQKREVTLRVAPNTFSEFKAKSKIRELNKKKATLDQAMIGASYKKVILKNIVDIEISRKKIVLIEKQLETLEKVKKAYELNMNLASKEQSQYIDTLFKIDSSRKHAENLKKIIQIKLTQLNNVSGTNFTSQDELPKIISITGVKGNLERLKLSKENAQLGLLKIESDLQKHSYDLISKENNSLFSFVEFSREMGIEEVTQFKVGFTLPFGVSSSNREVFASAYENTRLKAKLNFADNQVSSEKKEKLLEVESLISDIDNMSDSEVSQALNKHMKIAKATKAQNPLSYLKLTLLDNAKKIETLSLEKEVFHKYFDLAYEVDPANDKLVIEN